MASSRPAAALDSPEELIRRAAQGDVAAFARIIRLHHEEMTQVGFLVVGNVAGAAAAVVAALPVAWRRLGRAPAAERLGSWLCSLAASEAAVLARSELAPGGAGPITPTGPIAPGVPGVPAPDGAALAPFAPADRPVDAGLERAGPSP